MKKFLKRLKLNSKGFTLVEIIATVTVIGILSGTAIYSGYTTMSKAHIDYCTSLSDNLVIAARDYFNDNRLLLPKDYEKISCVTLQKLISDKYIEEMKDYDNNSCDNANSKVCSIKETNETFFYNPILSCNKCITANSLNPGAEAPSITYTPNSATVDNKDVNVTIGMRGNSSNTKKVVSYQYQVYKIPTASSDISAGTMVSGSTDYKKYTGDPKVKLTEEGIYKIKATAINEDGRKVSKISGAYTVKRTFTTNAECDSKAVTTTITSGWNERIWKNGELNVKFTKKGIVDRYDVIIQRSNCKNKEICGSWETKFKKINKATTNKTFTSNSSQSAKYIIKVIAYDAEGNKCEYSKEYWQDNDIPTCATSYSSPSGYSGQYVKTNVTVKGTCSDTGGSGCTNATRTITNTLTTDRNSQETPGTVRDEAENTRTCPSKLVKIDKTPPSCSTSYSSPSGYSGQYVKTNVTVKGTCSDPTVNGASSGCSRSSITNTLTSDRNSQETPGTITDKVGNSTTCPSKLVKIDKTPPTCGAKSGGNTTWKKDGSVTVGVNCSDPTVNGASSGCTKTKFTDSISNEAKQKNVSITIIDKVGNPRSCPNTYNIFIDKTPPRCGSYSGDNNSWKKTCSLTVSVGCTDPTGTDNAKSGCKQSTFSTTTHSQVKTERLDINIEDVAGNKTPCGKTFNVFQDCTPPTYTVSGTHCPSGTVGGTSGYRKGTSVSVTCKDTLSGIQSGSGSFSARSGTISTCRDNANNSTSVSISACENSANCSACGTHTESKTKTCQTGENDCSCVPSNANVYKMKCPSRDCSLSGVTKCYYTIDVCNVCWHY